MKVFSVSATTIAVLAVVFPIMGLSASASTPAALLAVIRPIVALISGLITPGAFTTRPVVLTKQASNFHFTPFSVLCKLPQALVNHLMLPLGNV